MSDPQYDSGPTSNDLLETLIAENNPPAPAPAAPSPTPPSPDLTTQAIGCAELDISPLPEPNPSRSWGTIL